MLLLGDFFASITDKSAVSISPPFGAKPGSEESLGSGQSLGSERILASERSLGSKQSLGSGQNQGEVPKPLSYSRRLFGTESRSYSVSIGLSCMLPSSPLMLMELIFSLPSASV